MLVRILLVEDNPADAQLAIDSLSLTASGARFEVIQAASLAEAAGRLAESLFDIILLDLGLPDAGGFDALTRIAERAPGVPILVLADQRDELLGVQAVRKGAQDYLIKRKGRHERLVRSVLFALERNRSVQHLSRLAHRDHLTDIPNRRVLYDRLRLSVARARRSGGVLALMFLDLDRFKWINDTFGHTVGDLLLQGVARRLRSCTRETDTVARLGGDEFAIVVSEIPSADQITSLAQKILDSLSPPFVVEGQELRVTASMGISLFPGDGRDAGALINSADEAMYGAKQAGRARYQFYSPAMHARAKERIDLAVGLRHALDHGGLVLRWIPMVSLRTGLTVGVEALVRWRSPERGLVAPAEFLPLAEETGLIEPVDEWVIHEAARQARGWSAVTDGRLRLGVNLSARELGRVGLPAMVGSALRESGLEPGNLQFDVAEAGLVRSGDRGRQAIERLRGAGVRIAIDDFGTSSSLAQLRRLPVTMLKIDRSLVRDVTRDASDAVIHEALISMAHGLGMEVGAEGVEREDQIDFLRRHQCDFAQGFYFSSPVSADEMELKLAGERLLRPTRVPP